jgi:hypothetical protein
MPGQARRLLALAVIYDGASSGTSHGREGNRTEFDSGRLRSNKTGIQGISCSCLGTASSSEAYALFTKSTQSTGPESIGPERTFPGLLAPWPVLSPSRITLENNGKIRPQSDRENAFARASGGDGGIRTLDTAYHRITV